MERRKFITNTGLGILGICIASNLVRCSSKDKIDLNDILGKSENILLTITSIKKEGNTNFSYYILSDSNFFYEKQEIKKAFIFCKDSRIVGFTIQIEGNKFIKEKVKELNSKFKNFKLNFENDFGKEYQWSDNKKIIKLSYNDYSDLPELTFYSEFLIESKLIIS